MENNEQQQMSLEQQLAEAEQRGYRRGLEEQIKAKMNEPGVWESPQPAGAKVDTQPGFRVLAERRRSIWDND
ncbi:MAG: hypothetical protein K2L05_06460 [Muribaculaceae bacterium]|nr:hypothetical protein [Muribaculaceae bacterium]